MKKNAWILAAVPAAGLAVCGGSAVSCKSERNPGKAPRPNILLIVSDDQSYPFAGAYGCSWVRTPGFDFVAENGILFNNCYTPNAKSAPSRAGLLTGRYSWQLEEAGNHITHWPEGKYSTVFEALGAHGYRTGFTGKGWAPGDPGKRPDGKNRQLTGKPYQKREVADPPTTELGKWDYAANFADFLADDDGEPWIFWMGIREPHRKYQYGTGLSLTGKTADDVDRVPSYWPDNEVVRTDLLDFAYEIEYYDAHIVRAIEMLREAGQLDNTLIIWTSDNGMPFPRRKGNSYEGSTHLPLAVMWPSGLRNPGRVSDELVSLVDITPTILELAGVTAGEIGMEPTWGTSFKDILEDRTRHRDCLLLGRERHDDSRPENQGYPIRGIIMDGYLYLHNFKPALWPAGNPETGYRDCDSSPTKTAILQLRRDGRDVHFWNYCFNFRPEEELYDLRSDPDCMTNLSGDARFAERLGAMKALLEQKLTEQGDPRMRGEGDIFDKYPFFKPSFQDFYERYLRGEVDPEENKTFLMSDYESIPSQLPE